MKVAQESAHAILIRELKCVRAPVLHLLFITSYRENKEETKERKAKSRNKEKKANEKEKRERKRKTEFFFNCHCDDDDDAKYL